MIADQEQREAFAAWDRVIEQQRKLHGDRVMSLIEAAAQAQEDFDIEELDTGRDNNAR